MADRFRMLPSYHYEDNTDGNLLKSVGKPLRDYKIEGNCFQDGTPSPDNPIDIQCCGELVVNENDENYGKYKIPVTVSNNNGEKTYNIFLDEPLRKVGIYIDYIDFRNSKVVRELTTVQFTGGETWIDYAGNTTNTYQTRSTKGYILKGLCNYYPVMSSKEIGMKNGTYVDYTGTHIITDLNCNTVDELKAFLKNAYDSGNPVTHILKIRNTIFEQTVNLPRILTEKHTNIISVGTTLQPSKVNYQYYKGGK